MQTKLNFSKEELDKVAQYTYNMPNKCFACGSDVLPFRMESHHVLGQGNKLQVPLCVLCHDIIDRMNLDNPIVFRGMANNCLQT